jgi:hypothetical protein
LGRKNEKDREKMSPLEITLMRQPNDPAHYVPAWTDSGIVAPGLLLWAWPERYLDLCIFVIARTLLESGHELNRQLVVYVEGRDTPLMAATLANAAAPPLINPNPAQRPQVIPMKRKRRHKSGEVAAA